MIAIVSPETALRVYVAGPMTGYPDNNFPAFHSAARALRAAGFDVVNPAEIVPESGAKDWAAYMRADIRELVTCDVVALLPGWETSKGAAIEQGLAVALGMPAVDIAQCLNP